MLTVETVTGERRRSSRWRTDKPITWHERGGGRLCNGRVCERSLEGMVVVTQGGNPVPCGTHLAPGDMRMGVRHGFRHAIVRRTERRPGGRQLLFIEILS